MGIELVRIVEYVRQNSKGLVAIDLARLNLKVGKALSRQAAILDDDPALVSAAWDAAKELVGERGRRGM